MEIWDMVWYEFIHHVIGIIGSHSIETESDKGNRRPQFDLHVHFGAFLILCRTLFEEDIEISDVAEALWNSDFAVLAHDTSEPEPVFVYGNQVRN